VLNQDLFQANTFNYFRLREIIQDYDAKSQF